MQMNERSVHHLFRVRVISISMCHVTISLCSQVVIVTKPDLNPFSQLLTKLEVLVIYSVLRTLYIYILSTV